MPRSQAKTLPESRQLSSAARPGAARGGATSPLDTSPRMLAQRRQIQSLFGAGKVLQGFFDLAGQPTNDPDRFADNTSEEDKRAQVWPQLKEAIEAAWKKLPKHHFTAEMVDEFKVKMLTHAFSDVKVTVKGAAQYLEAQAVERKRLADLREAELAESRKELTERASPGGVGGTLKTTPELAGKEKHSLATYRRTSPGVDEGEAVVTEETFDSDDYTKGPAKRQRGGKAITTPLGTKQTWTKKNVTDSITSWPCEAPLARHLAQTVWPHLANTDEGRKWERKFREIDRLVSHRDDEGMGGFIEILNAVTQAKVKSLGRDDYTKAARELMKVQLIAGTKHPAEQTGVLFYDVLLRAAVDGSWLATGPEFKLKPAYKVAGSLSMILTHWRTILLFDWILAEDVMNNAT